MPNDQESSVPATASSEPQQHKTAGGRFGFFGAFNHSIDPKGRMIVPQNFREKLGPDIIVGLNMAQTSIAIFPRSVWQKRLDMLTELAEKDISAEAFLERFAMFSFDNCSFDIQGRVLLPAVLRDMFLKDVQAVQISGAREYIKITPSERAMKDTEEFLTKHPDVLDAISVIQARVRDSER